MRVLIVVLISLIAAPPLAAQQIIESPLRRSAEPAMPELAAPPVAPAPTLFPAASVQPGSVADAQAHHASQTAILDETFWRQILAGVIITVVSTLILRAIL